MKKFLAAGVATVGLCGASAYAADLPAKAPYFKASPLAVYDWTGWYGGVNGGLGVSQTHGKSIQDPNQIGSFDRGDVGFAGGVQGGFNWQFAPQWVAGIEGDIGYLGINRSFAEWNDPIVFDIKTNWYGTIRGRVGYSSGPSLFYATGGAAFVNVKNNFDEFSFGAPASKSETAAGWTVGGGVETMLGGNWSAKAEYLYIDAGSQNVFNPDRVDTIHFDNRFHVYRYGLNYKFGGPAVAAGALPAHNWTGLYAGVNMGAGLSQTAVNATAPVGEGTGVDIADAGFTGGVEAGYNWQFAPNGVAGIAGDVGYLGLKRSFIDWGGIAGSNIVPGTRTDWYGTLRGRLGYSTGPALLYITGGAAFVNVKNNIDDSSIFTFSSKSETAVGWTMGGGIESMLTQNWTAKTEYLYIDVGSQDVVNPNINGIGAVTAHFNNRFHVFRFGLNYAFGGH